MYQRTQCGQYSGTLTFTPLGPLEPRIPALPRFPCKSWDWIKAEEMHSVHGAKPTNPQTKRSPIFMLQRRRVSLPSFRCVQVFRHLPPCQDPPETPTHGMEPSAPLFSLPWTPSCHVCTLSPCLSQLSVYRGRRNCNIASRLTYVCSRDCAHLYD